jgi:hypothetical protein
VRVQLAGLGFEGGIVDGVGVVGAFESVVASVCESLFATRPADVVFRLGLLDLGCGRIVLARKPMDI